VNLLDLALARCGAVAARSYLAAVLICTSVNVATPLSAVAVNGRSDAEDLGTNPSVSRVVSSLVTRLPY